MALDLDTRQQLVEAVRRFVAGRLRPLEAKVAEEDAMPSDVVDEMKGLGLFGLSIPEQYGGLDLSMEDECLVAVELGHTSPAFRSTFGTNVGIGSQGLVMFGTDAQKEKYLPGIASGEIVTSFALTEPEAGSDSANVQTKAVRDGDDYVLNGSKRFITNANKADLFTVMARTDAEKPGAGGVSAFLVERSLPGLSVGKPEKKMGQQGAHICDVIFENVRVPAENRLGHEGEGFKVAMRTFDRSRPWIAAGASGLIRRALEESRKYALERKTFGVPIAQHQAVQFMLAEMAIAHETTRLLYQKAAWMIDQGQERGSFDSSVSCIAKAYGADAAMRVSTDAVQIFGGYGYTKEYPVEKLMRDAKLLQIYEGTSQIQRMVIARNILSEP